jgi:hypothetical protein
MSSVLADYIAAGTRTAQVLLGIVPPHSLATPGPTRLSGGGAGLVASTLPFLFSTVIVSCYALTLEAIGFQVGKALGLRPGKAKRFSAAMTECLHYTLMLFVALGCFWRENWLWPSGWHEVMHDGRVHMVKGQNNDVPLGVYEVPAELQFYYSIELGWYLQGFIRLLLEGGRTDCLEMAFHHIVTGMLICLSWSTGYIRIGIVVLILHNLFDPFLHLAKCTHYLKWPVVPDVSFGICVITFAVSRLYFYPQAIWQAWMGVCVGNATCPGGTWDKTAVEFYLMALLFALLPIHCLWFFMLLKVLKKALLSSGVQGDVRSDSEDEEEPEDKKKKLTKHE